LAVAFTRKVKSGSISFQGLVGARRCSSLQLLWRSADFGRGAFSSFVQLASRSSRDISGETSSRRSYRWNQYHKENSGKKCGYCQETNH
jgi:hypothetical protein